ncbi:MAG: tetratricopeptide repeat protein [bacterium]
MDEQVNAQSNNSGQEWRKANQYKGITKLAESEVIDGKVKLEVEKTQKDYEKQIEKANLIFYLKVLLIEGKITKEEVNAIVSGNAQTYIETNALIKEGDKRFNNTQFDAAEIKYNKAKDGIIQLYDQFSLQNANLLNKLGCVASARIKSNEDVEILKEADKLLNQSLSIRQELSDNPDTDPSIMEAYLNLSKLYFKFKDSEKLIKFSREHALKASEFAEKIHSKEAADTLLHTSQVLEFSDEKEQAAKFEVKAGKKYLSVGEAHLTAGNKEISEECVTKAKELLKKNNDKDSILSFMYLTSISNDKNKIETLEKISNIVANDYGNTSIELAKCHSETAINLYRQDKTEAGIEKFNKVLDILKSNEQSDVNDQVLINKLLSQGYKKIGNNNKAEQSLSDAYKILLANPQSDKNMFADISLDLGGLKYTKGQNKEARKYLENAFSIYSSNPIAFNKEYLESATKLGIVYYKLSENDKSLKGKAKQLLEMAQNLPNTYGVQSQNILEYQGLSSYYLAKLAEENDDYNLSRQLIFKSADTFAMVKEINNTPESLFAFKKAVEQIKEKEPSKAVEYLKKIILVDCSSESTDLELLKWTYNSLIDLYEKMGDKTLSDRYKEKLRVITY